MNTLRIIQLSVVIVIALIVSKNSMAQPNGQGNALWKPKGQDTVFTNRNLLVNKNARIIGRLTVGTKALTVGGSFVGPGDDIISDAGEIYLGRDVGGSFDPNIKVGIGTQAPNFMLDVAEDVNIGSGRFYRIGGTRVLATNGASNTFIGDNAGNIVAPGGENTFVGNSSGLNSANTARNTFVGNLTGVNNTGSYNTFVGADAGRLNTTGIQNSFFGVNAGLKNSAGSANANSFFGFGCGSQNTTGSQNAFFGADAGYNSTGSHNSFFGTNTGFNNGSGNRNAFFGYQAGVLNTVSENSFFGSEAGRINVTGLRNSFFGFNAGFNNVTAGDNSFFGYRAGRANSTGTLNSFFGSFAGTNTFSGSRNVFVGSDAGRFNGFGSDNVSVGNDAGIISQGFDNVFVGSGAGSTTVDTDRNVFVGKDAGNGNSGGANTYIGYKARGASGNNNAAAIGANAFVNGSNRLVLGSISGVNGASASSRVGIGVTAPINKLEVNSELTDRSGLTFTQLNSSSATIGSNPGPGVLAVSSTGEVVYVDTPAGVACWDTDEDGICDPSEDADGSGTCDVADCQALASADADWHDPATGASPPLIGDNVYTEGNVGIGPFFANSLIPQSPLHLYQPSGIVKMQFTNNVTGNSALNGFNVGILDNGTAGIAQLYNAPMIFITPDGFGNNVTRMSILDNTGFVGIGNTPTERLDVDGKLRIRTIDLDNTLDEVLVRDAAGVVYRRDVSTLLDGDWAFVSGNSINDPIFRNGTVTIGSNTPAGLFSVSNNPPNQPFPTVLFDTDVTGQFGNLSAVVMEMSGTHTAGTASLLEVNMTANSNSGTAGAKVRVAGSSVVASHGLDVIVSSASAVNRGLRVHAESALQNYGIYTTANQGSSSNIGIYAFAFGPPTSTVRAGLFDGNVEIINGTLIPSDSTLKDNIQDIDSALAIINQLHPVKFHYDTANFPMSFDGELKYGLIAQEAEQVLPTIVRNSFYPAQYDSVNNQISPSIQYKSANYTMLIPILIQAIKEQNEVIDSLTASINSMPNNLLSSWMDSIENCLSNLPPGLACNNGGSMNKMSGGNGYENGKYCITSVINVVPDNTVISKGTKLEQNKPNPFNYITQFEYFLGESGHVELIINSYSGQYITTLVDEAQDGGSYTVDWNTVDLTPGVYFYTLRVDGVDWVKKAIKLR